MTSTSIGLRGFDRRNLGSHLMALAVVYRLPDSTVAIPLRAARMSREDTLEGTAVWLWSEIGGPPVLHRTSSTVFEPSSRWAVGPRGPVPVTGVVDISGYIYGEPFGMGPVRRLEDWGRRWSERDAPLVLLPQSIGPFTRRQDEQAMRRALEQVRIVVVRDDHSEDCVRNLGGSCEILRSPDLAIESARRLAVERPASLSDRRLRPYALFLPNRQVLRKLDVDERGYLALLEQAAAQCTAAGLDIVVAAHERGSDDILCAAVARSVPCAQLLEVSSATAMVKAIRDAELVVSSRYHGLVVGLATGVPSIALGWATKYDDLLNEFGVPQLSAPLAKGDQWSDAVASMVGEVIDDLPTLSKQLTARGDDLQAQLDGMWSRVIPVLTSGSAS